MSESIGSGDSEGQGEQSADDYLSKLARSVLSKEKTGHPAPPHQGRPIAPPRPRTLATPPPVRPAMPSTPLPRAGDSRQTPMPPTPSTFVSQAGSAPRTGHGDWVRDVPMYDSAGNLIPGTILLFEDGTVGVFKESNPVKEYDIVYVLRDSGRVVPQGMPLYTYDVDAIGRLSQGCFDQLANTGRWERDMMVFHLLKYKDHVHIPQINDPASDTITPSPMDRVTTMSVRKLNASERAVTTEEDKEKQAFVRGRRLTIDFGPQQKWEAIYWGKDELGHVVAHNTHDKWALMHLDLARFKDSIVVHDFVDLATQKKMEQDFTSA